MAAIRSARRSSSSARSSSGVAAQRALAPIGQAQAGPAPAFHLGAGLSPGEELNALLARAALLLRDAGCLRGWRNELLDVFGESGCVGAIERAAMRPLGLLTRAVHLNGWTPDGRLWIARRSLTKSTDPGMWDTLVGGLVGAGEALDEALLRECDEEAGLDAGHLARRAPLRTIVRIHRRIPEGYQVEDVIAADCVLAADVQPANRDGEVMEIRAAAVDDVLRMIDAGEFTDEAALVILDDIRRRAGVEKVTYDHPLTERALRKTLGVPLFQEQLMQLAIDVAGFSAAEAAETAGEQTQSKKSS